MYNSSKRKIIVIAALLTAFMLSIGVFGALPLATEGESVAYAAIANNQ